MAIANAYEAQTHYATTGAGTFWDPASNQIDKIAFWYFPDDTSTAGNACTLFSSPAGTALGGVGTQWLIDTSANANGIRFSFTSSTWSNETWIYNSATYLADDVWHHIVITVDYGNGGDCNLYVDGVLRTWDTDPAMPNQISADGDTMGLLTANNWVDLIRIAEVAIWGTTGGSEFTQNEVDTLYNGGVMLRNAPFLVRPTEMRHYWTCDGPNGGLVPTTGDPITDVFAGVHMNDAGSTQLDYIQDPLVMNYNSTVTVAAGAEPPANVFFENRHPIEHGMKPQTAAGMGGVLIE